MHNLPKNLVNNYFPELRIFEAEPVQELPSRAKVTWPRSKRPRYSTIVRSRKSSILPLRDRIHIQIAQEANLNLKKCSLCGIERKWGNFDVHHINGDHNDNRPENLIVLCRDCHINIEHGYSAASFPSDSDGVFVEDTDGILEEY